MTVRLRKGDAVLVQTDDKDEAIGLIKYVGPMVDHDMMAEYVGVELLESTPSGHNGEIDGFTYFTAKKGHGFHTKMTNVIKKLSTPELFTHMRYLYGLVQRKARYINRLETQLTTKDKNKIMPAIYHVSENSNESYQSEQSIQSMLSMQSRLSHLTLSPNNTLNKSGPYKLRANISVGSKISECSMSRSDTPPHLSNDNTKNSKLTNFTSVTSVVSDSSDSESYFISNEQSASHDIIDTVSRRNSNKSIQRPRRRRRAQSSIQIDSLPDIKTRADYKQPQIACPILIPTNSTSSKNNIMVCNAPYASFNHSAPAPYNNCIVTQNTAMYYPPVRVNNGYPYYAYNGTADGLNRNVNYVSMTPPSRATSYTAPLYDYYHATVPTTPTTPLSVQSPSTKNVYKVTYEPSHLRQNK